MQQFVNGWASGLIVAVIIVTIIELVLPENKNKKYIKVVGGLFILFTIISPVIQKFGGDIKLNIEEYTNKLLPEEVMESQETASFVTDKNIMKVYKENLKRNIKSGIENLNYIVNSIDIDVDESKNYGDIKKIYLDVEGVQLINNINIEKVDVNINNNISNEDSNDVKLVENDKEIIKDFLNKNYRISSKDIYINEGR